MQGRTVRTNLLRTGQFATCARGVSAQCALLVLPRCLQLWQVQYLKCSAALQASHANIVTTIRRQTPHRPSLAVPTCLDIAACKPPARIRLVDDHTSGLAVVLPGVESIYTPTCRRERRPRAEHLSVPPSLPPPDKIASWQTTTMRPMPPPATRLPTCRSSVTTSPSSHPAMLSRPLPLPPPPSRKKRPS